MKAVNARTRRINERAITLPGTHYDVVGSVVLYKTALEELERAINQFLAAPLNSHLCILDNSPAPTALPEYDPNRVSYHFTGENLGYGRAHNLALRAAEGKTRYSLVMNTDIWYSPDTIPHLASFMDCRKEAGMVAPKILYPDGSLQYVCRLLPTPTNLFLRRFLPNAIWTRKADARYELRSWPHNTVANIPYFQGSFMLLRTALCNSIGGFDERFFLYGEDIDLTRRVHQVAETLYVPDACVTHEYRRYSNRSPLGTWHGIRNNARYFNKWGWFFDSGRRRINRKVIASLAGLS